MKNFNKFMYGRYGVDELYNFLFKTYLVLFIFNLFINSSILNYLEIIIVIIIVYRFMSKNINKRKEENNIYLNIKNNILKTFSSLKTRYKNGYIYKNCPKCKKLLKLPLPYKRGIKMVICPKCKKKFKMIVLRKEKIEIISNKR